MKIPRELLTARTCERCGAPLPLWYKLRYCQLCRKETLDQYMRRGKTPEW